MTWLFVGLAALALAATAWRGFIVVRDVRAHGNALTGKQGRVRQVFSFALFAVFALILLVVVILQLSGVVH